MRYLTCDDAGFRDSGHELTKIELADRLPSSQVQLVPINESAFDTGKGINCCEEILLIGLSAAWNLL